MKSFQAQTGIFANLTEDLPIGEDLPAGSRLPRRIGSRDLRETLKPVRKQITDAAGQLKDITGRPLVVILVNPSGVPVPLSPAMIASAMYGDMTVEIPIGPDSSGEAVWRVGRNGRLHVADPETGEHQRGNHSYVSAVGVLRSEDLAFSAWSQEWFSGQAGIASASEATVEYLKAAAGPGVPHSDDVFLHLVEAVSPEAVPLPREVFNGPQDRRWVPNEERTALVPLT